MPVSTEIIIDVCKYLNEIINNNAKRLIEKYNNNPYLYSQFTFHNFAESLDEILITIFLHSLYGERENFCQEKMIK